MSLPLPRVGDQALSGGAAPPYASEGSSVEPRSAHQDSTTSNNTPTVISADAASSANASREDNAVAPSSPAETLRGETTTPAPMHQSPPPPIASASHALQQTLSMNNLEQEVGQVMGTLNSWWGGVKKQSASALSTIRADIDKTVSQAQADLEYLRTAKVEIARKTTDDVPESAPPKVDSSSGSDPAKGDEIHDAAVNSLLDRLSSSTTQLQHTLQSTFQSTLVSAASNPALSNPSQLRAQLAENLRLSSAKANLQLSMKQAEKMAEEYLRKGDQWVKDAEKWMGDAVKVVPPDADEQRYIATSFDGADVYSFSTSTSRTKAGTMLFDAEARTPRPSTSAVTASRKDTLLQRLREDKQLLLVDPMGSEETAQRRDDFSSWIRDHWSKASAAKEHELETVGEIRMALVPEMISDEQFWQRYLFHKHMIEAEIEKRRKLLAATSQEAVDDFSWDDEPEDGAVPPPAATTKTVNADGVSTSPAKSAVKSAPKVLANSTTTSPRDSEESYDLVSDQGTRAATIRPLTKGDPDDDEDSDWE